MKKVLLLTLLSAGLFLGGCASNTRTTVDLTPIGAKVNIADQRIHKAQQQVTALEKQLNAQGDVLNKFQEIQHQLVRADANLAIVTKLVPTLQVKINKVEKERDTYLDERDKLQATVDKQDAALWKRDCIIMGMAGLAFAYLVVRFWGPIAGVAAKVALIAGS